MPDAAKFVITGARSFVPSYFPETLRVRKQRELDRSRGFCGGENVSDKGSKNRDIHVTGLLRGKKQKAQLDEVADHGGPFTVSSETWSGEVRVKEVEYEGPTTWHGETDQWHWKYTLDLVSTGTDEPEETSGSQPLSGATVTFDTSGGSGV